MKKIRLMALLCAMLVMAGMSAQTSGSQAKGLFSTFLKGGSYVRVPESALKNSPKIDVFGFNPTDSGIDMSSLKGIEIVSTGWTPAENASRIVEGAQSILEKEGGSLVSLTSSSESMRQVYALGLNGNIASRGICMITTSTGVLGSNVKIIYIDGKADIKKLLAVKKEHSGEDWKRHFEAQ